MVGFPTPSQIKCVPEGQSEKRKEKAAGSQAVNKDKHQDMLAMLTPAYITTSNLMQTSFHCPIAILTLNPKGLIEIYICLNSSASGCSEMD